LAPGPVGPPGSPGSPGIDGRDAPPGPPPKPRGFFFTFHSQIARAPDCPKGTLSLWEGYSLLHIMGNSKDHGQDLGKNMNIGKARKGQGMLDKGTISYKVQKYWKCILVQDS